ncbi:MAG: metalloregulator ArsR/SmtB family transcription factor [Peptoniphilaceae bacterium]|nr:metalloregulator ArsR/SmtB family transcription factor [Peptoniphilaceae bacterium]MDD7383040.1 metalloregulator ArsR/SmtB family transcription factor [Peptoniphilaceae bacterium]MDY3737548.1 metalloregulator ArsR/SmtB family transcription factor [Peptoniphilaceae bacterium]
MKKEKEFAEICEINCVHENVVNKINSNKKDFEKLDTLSKFFKIFSDETRLKIIWALDKHELCVCDLQAVLNMSQSAISHQLALLKKSNLVKSRKEGRIVFYSLSDWHVVSIFEKGMEHILEE